MNNEFGALTGPAMGILFKEAIMRAINAIEVERRRLEVQGKVTDYAPNKSDDIVTNADFAAQREIMNVVKQCFPSYSVVAEEENLRIVSHQSEFFITVDPCDGTKALKRGQSHGFGPMVSICDKEDVLGAFVGDVMTGEVYYYRPQGTKVHRLNIKTGAHSVLAIDAGKKLSSQYALLRNDPRRLKFEMARFTISEQVGGIFRDIEVSGGGIGTWFARLWKGEVGACVVDPTNNTPWDLLPVWGISKKLGFSFLYWHEGDGVSEWRQREHLPTMNFVRWHGHTYVIHDSRIDEFVKRTERFMLEGEHPVAH
jgi:fructose-1,6-bisphosphatase/inositol monophosphatase family enzyme